MQHATCFRIKLLSVPPTQEAGLPWKIWGKVLYLIDK